MICLDSKVGGIAKKIQIQRAHQGVILLGIKRDPCGADRQIKRQRMGGG